MPAGGDNDDFPQHIVEEFEEKQGHYTYTKNLQPQQHVTEKQG